MIFDMFASAGWTLKRSHIRLKSSLNHIHATMNLSLSAAALASWAASPPPGAAAIASAANEEYASQPLAARAASPGVLGGHRRRAVESASAFRDEGTGDGGAADVGILGRRRGLSLQRSSRNLRRLQPQCFSADFDVDWSDPYAFAGCFSRIDAYCKEALVDGVAPQALVECLSENRGFTRRRRPPTPVCIVGTSTAWWVPGG